MKLDSFFSMSAKILILSCFTVFIGCNLNNSDSSEEAEVEILPELPPAFEDQFSMVINGESWEDYFPEGFDNATYYTIPLAILSKMGESDDSLIQIANYKHQVSISLSEVKNYYDFVAFHDIFDKDLNSYPVQSSRMIEGVNRGFVYGEYVGGDDILYYYPIEAESNTFNVEMKSDEYGRRYMQGSFAVTLTVDSTKLDSSFLPFRHRPDTLVITQGQFSLELNASN